MRGHTMSWNHDGWDIEFMAIPIEPESRGNEQRVIGIQMNGAKWLNVWEPIRDAVMAKGNRYGKLGKPLLIAVNVDTLSLSAMDEMQALFGQEQIILNRQDLSAEPKRRRLPNGAWSGPDGIRYKRVSGVLIVGALNPWNIVSRRNTLYLHPRAALELPESLKKMNHAIVSKDDIKRVEGSSLAEILELPTSWPE